MVVPPSTTTASVLHTDVLDRLGREIVHGAKPVGTVMTLAGLAEEYGVSRTVVREAIRVLESTGMVEARRRVGVTVQPATGWNTLDPRLIRWRLTSPQRDDQLHRLTELRLAIEPTAARLAATRATPEVRARLQELATILRRLGEVGRGADQEYLDADVEFHTLLIEATGNDMLGALRRVIQEVLEGRTELQLTPARPVPESLDHHELLAHAVATGDEDAAENHARAIVIEVWRELRDATFTPPLARD
ncbi:MAG: FadR/GntR family transcriptional regulator [Georgenia sp.]